MIQVMIKGSHRRKLILHGAEFHMRLKILCTPETVYYISQPMAMKAFRNPVRDTSEFTANHCIMGNSESNYSLWKCKWGMYACVRVGRGS